MSSSASAHSRTHLAGICVVALTALAYQVLMTRIFSVMLFYHYAFAGISLAMLGMTVGAQKVFLEKERFAPKRLEEEFTRAALGFAVSGAALIILFIYSPIILPPSLCSLFLLLFIVPFTYSGICVTLLLTKSTVAVGNLYAADLIGASLGCLGIVAILFLLDPITVCFGLSMLTAFAAVAMAKKARRLVEPSKMIAALFFLLFTGHGMLYLTHQPHLGIVWAKGEKQELALFERWNAFSLVRVVPIDSIPYGWGFGHPQTKPVNQQLKLDIDAQASTVITGFDGKNLKPLSYLSDDVVNLGYQIRPVGSAAVIGVGGGRDILSAIYFGAKHVTGIELNPSIFEALTRAFGNFSGHLDQRPDVHLVNAEARSWLNHSAQSFDLVQISLIDTWAVIASSGLSLSENKLYTVEAWTDFMDRLTPKGMLTVSRWFDPEHHRGEFYRLLSIAGEALKRRGVPADEIARHIMVFSVDNHNTNMQTLAGVVTIAVSPTAFTDAEVAKTKTFADKYGFRPLMLPGHAWDDVSRRIVSGQADAAFYNSLPMDVTPTTDDRPFFFHMRRLKDMFIPSASATDDAVKGNRDYITGNSNGAQSIIYALLVGTFFCTVYFVAIPLLTVLKKMPEKREVYPYLGYFSGIGLGFMLVEISQMQRLMIFLGHPIFGLTVVLFTLLLFGGIGSAAINRLLEKKHIILTTWPALLCAVLAAVGLLTPVVTEEFKGADTLTRIIMSAAFLAPAGFCMGMMFPIGMKMTTRFRDLQPWLWGVNGATSVFASILGAILSMEFGMSAAFWTGVACYFACAVLVHREAHHKA